MVSVSVQTCLIGTFTLYDGYINCKFENTFQVKSVSVLSVVFVLAKLYMDAILLLWLPVRVLFEYYKLLLQSVNSDQFFCIHVFAYLWLIFMIDLKQISINCSDISLHC